MIGRWLKILLLCRVGSHGRVLQYPLANDMVINECTRCRCMTINRQGRYYHFIRRPAWSVARGQYDRSPI